VGRTDFTGQVESYEPMMSFGAEAAEVYDDSLRGDETETGRVALPLASRGVRVDGIDLSDAMVAKLRAKPGGEQLSVTMGDFADVPVPGRSLNAARDRILARSLGSADGETGSDREHGWAGVGLLIGCVFERHDELRDVEVAVRGFGDLRRRSCRVQGRCQLSGRHRCERRNLRSPRQQVSERLRGFDRVAGREL
jgi:hypothetical protein